LQFTFANRTMNYTTGHTENYLMQMRVCICIVMTYGHQWVTASKTSKKLPKIKEHHKTVKCVRHESKSNVFNENPTTAYYTP